MSGFKPQSHALRSVLDQGTFGFLESDGSVPTSGVRNKQLPTCPSRVKFGGGKLMLLQGCPQDNLKFSKKCLISSFLDELNYKFKAMTIGLYL